MLRLNVINKKQCSKCMKFLSLCMFYKRGDGKRSLRSHCKICLRNSDNKKKSDKKYYDTHRESILKKKRVYQKRSQVIKHRQQYSYIYYRKVIKPKNDAKPKIKRVKQTLKEKRAKQRIHFRKRYRIDVEYKIRKTLRTRLWEALQKNKYSSYIKVGSHIGDLGCTTKYLREYLESKFYPHPKTGEIMTWKNWGVHGWHIDHIIPLSAFNLTDKNQLQKAVHYTNLQPLWAEENLAKNNRIDRDFF